MGAQIEGLARSVLLHSLWFVANCIVFIEVVLIIAYLCCYVRLVYSTVGSD